MADLNKLVARARELKHRDIGWWAAAEQAIRGQGITNVYDLKRLKTQVVEKCNPSLRRKR